jgi:hypothetical protein
LPGRGRYFTSGQWARPGGGRPGIAPAARGLINRLRERDRRLFFTSLAPPASRPLRGSLGSYVPLTERKGDVYLATVES